VAEVIRTGRGGEVRLHYEAEGSGAPAVVFVHGLAGHCGEWAATGRALAAEYRTIRIDQRAHGHSSRHPADLSREAFADDVAAVIEHAQVSTPVTLVGQSMGAHTALVAADRHPGLVSHLIMVEGDVGGGGPEPLAAVTEAIQSWPGSFASHQEAADFFGGDTAAARAWADGYVPRDGRWWPLFDPDLTGPIMAPVFAAERWDIWGRLALRADLVLAERSMISEARIDRMCAVRPQTGRYTIRDAGHDVHLDQPDRWLHRLRALLAR
jgi:pimeloyl-ACP methyl ester carboxylesterase